MYNGKTVEVMNTDAEGRLILADALSYAAKFDPELVFDVATLTGAAAMAVGKDGTVIMGTAPESCFDALTHAGELTYERVVQFPFWDEYGELIKSEVADIKNLGGSDSGAITAGKFLEHFVEAPWIHLDIAGPMWTASTYNYRGQGGTGVGVRLLFEFLRQRANTLQPNN
jgi:leucyl aminopeptidase